MPGCVLRIAGPTLNPAQAVEGLGIHPYRIWSDMDPNRPMRRSIPGCAFVVSDRNGEDLPGQISDAIRWARAHHDDLLYLAGLPEVTIREVDFGLVYREDQFHGPYLQADFPPDLLEAVAGLGIALQVSFYPVIDEDT